MQYKYQCICSNDTPLTTDLLDDENHADCDYKCPGDYKSYCGGEWNMNIYNLTPSSIKDSQENGGSIGIRGRKYGEGD